MHAVPHIPTAGFPAKQNSQAQTSKSFKREPKKGQFTCDSPVLNGFVCVYSDCVHDSTCSYHLFGSEAEQANPYSTLLLHQNIEGHPKIVVETLQTLASATAELCECSELHSDLCTTTHLSIILAGGLHIFDLLQFTNCHFSNLALLCVDTHFPYTANR
jgi:hypothetical protein